MDFRLSPEEHRFRNEVRQFFRENPPPRGGTGEDAGPDSYRRLLAERGWLTMHWPVEHGGKGATAMQQMIFKEEASRAGAPAGGSGVNMVGPTLILHGTPEQRAMFLPRIAGDEIQWCQGFSEPGAGSDLASLQTRAVRDGDDYVINGQKIWTSNAHLADWIFMLTRTDPEAPKHRGISYFLVDMKTPGITIAPLIQMTGVHGFNQVFFDNVRVPARQMVGEVNRGWYVATTTLDFERSGIERVLTAERDLARLERWLQEAECPARQRPSYQVLRHRIVDLRVAVEVSRVLAYRVAWMQSRNLVPNYEASMAKMFASDVGQAVARAAINTVGPPGQLLGGKHQVLAVSPAFRYCDSVRLTIGQGTGEIQRNIIAQRGLGLPRD